MKAIRAYEYGGPKVMVLEEVSPPEPSDGEVLVRVHAAGVNPVDTYLRSGTQGYDPPLPFTPGMDGAGVVAQIGDGVGHLSRGDRVYIIRSLTGTYAEMVLCRPEHVFVLPDKVSFEEGACLGVAYGTAMRAVVDKARVHVGETVFVHGASGGVGTAAVQIARALGARVAGTASTEAGRQLVRVQGADAAFDHGEERHLEDALAWTDGRGFDVVLEMAAERNLGAVLDVLASRGRAVVIGSRGDVTITPRDLMKRDAEVIGMSLLNADEQELTRIHERIYAGLESGVLKPVVREVLPLSEAPIAHERVMESGARGQLVLRIGADQEPGPP